jgi:hypothetical protein
MTGKTNRQNQSDLKENFGATAAQTSACLLGQIRHVLPRLIKTAAADSYR